MKYDLSDNQGEIIPNLLNIKDERKIELLEFEGFLNAEIKLSEKLYSKTKFNTKYILNLHKLALSDIYSFAGKLRAVNMSKSGFPFPAAKFLPQIMDDFDSDILSKLPNSYKTKTDLIKDISVVHAELLLIHPFREGNGRTARVCANLMSRKQGYKSLKFDLINEDVFNKYIKSVQKALEKDYILNAENY